MGTVHNTSKRLRRESALRPKLGALSDVLFGIRCCCERDPICEKEKRTTVENPTRRVEKKRGFRPGNVVEALGRTSRVGGGGLFGGGFWVEKWGWILFIFLNRNGVVTRAGKGWIKRLRTATVETRDQWLRERL